MKVADVSRLHRTINVSRSVVVTVAEVTGKRTTEHKVHRKSTATQADFMPSTIFSVATQMFFNMIIRYVVFCPSE